MALTPKKVYAILKKYTDNSIAGGGAIRGKNCVITSITSITGGHRVEFQWTLDNGTVQTDTMDVMDGAKGADGQDGADGAPGRDGLTPTIAISEITGGHKITVTIGSSTDDFDVMDGVGVPAGGTEGQVLKKKSDTDYDTEWASEGSGLPSGGTEGQILAKDSNADYDTKWVDPSAASQVQSDFGESDNTKVSFIKNKPTKLSDFSNDEGFIKNTVDNLVEYYKKSETYTQSEVNQLIAAISTLNIEVVNSLPTTDISLTTIYLVPKPVGTSVSNIYEEWICLDDTTTPAKWEKIGDTQIDLSNYIQKSVTPGLLKNDGTVDTTTYQKEITVSGKKVLI